MAVYKVPQDVEADDKLIGPFSFKQFVFIIIALGMGWLAFIASRINPFLSILPMPFFLGFLVLGLPLRKDQPTDVYVAALINFWLRPKTRLWGQEGMTEHVIVTAPKTDVHIYSDGLSRGEVKSRLINLAKTMDTRGWSSKNIDSPGYIPYVQSDRLVAATLQPDVLKIDESDIEDVLDTQNSEIARHFAVLESKTGTATIKQQAEIEEPVQSAPTPGAQFVPGQDKPNIPQPRTVAEIAAIADANNPVQHQQIAPIYTGKAKMPDISRFQQPSTSGPVTQQPAPDPISLVDDQTNLSANPDLSADKIDFNPYPEINQQVISPQSSSADVTKNTSQMTDDDKTDILEEDNKAFEEGGEISLH